MTSLFISDLHLSQERPDLTGLFLSFIEREAVRSDALYILGDLFEVWLGDDAIDEYHRPILSALEGLASRGIRVYVMHGNRDFLLGETFARHAGCQMLDDLHMLEIAGEKTLLMHGDLLCTDDLEYQAFRKQVRSPEWQRQILALPVEVRREQAKKLREYSKQSAGEKSQEIMDANPVTVIEFMRRNGVTRLIHGHTHRPGVHQMEIDGRPAMRIVLGDWGAQGSMVICDDQGCRLSAC